MRRTLGISDAQIGGTLLLELLDVIFHWISVRVLLGNGILSLVYQKLSGVFGVKGVWRCRDWSIRH